METYLSTYPYLNRQTDHILYTLIQLLCVCVCFFKSEYSSLCVYMCVFACGVGFINNMLKNNKGKRFEVRREASSDLQ